MGEAQGVELVHRMPDPFLLFHVKDNTSDNSALGEALIGPVKCSGESIVLAMIWPTLTPGEQTTVSQCRST